MNSLQRQIRKFVNFVEGASTTNKLNSKIFTFFVTTLFHSNANMSKSPRRVCSDNRTTKRQSFDKPVFDFADQRAVVTKIRTLAEQQRIDPRLMLYAVTVSSSDDEFPPNASDNRIIFSTDSVFISSFDGAE